MLQTKISHLSKSQESTSAPIGWILDFRFWILDCFCRTKNWKVLFKPYRTIKSYPKNHLDKKNYRRCGIGLSWKGFWIKANP